MQLNKRITERLIKLGNKQTNILEELEAQPNNWDEVPIDYPILVKRNEDYDWFIAHFAEYNYDRNKVSVYANGGTSLTVKNKENFEFAKLREEDKDRY